MKLNPEKVHEIVDNYENTIEQSLPLLMSDARVLACQLVAYADAVGDLGKKYRSLHVQRKTKFAELKSHFIKEKMSGTDASAEAEKNPGYVSLYESEYTYEGAYDKGKRTYSAIEKVLDRMNQEIAELRSERRYVNQTQPV